MLGTDERNFSCGEVYALFRPWRTHHFTPSCSCGNPNCEIWPNIKKEKECYVHKSISDLMNSKWVIDSSKSLPWVIDNNIWADKHGMKVVNLLTWKYPIELCYSHWKRDRGVDFWRKRFVPYYSRFIASGLPFISVYVGDLISNTPMKLKQICEAIGMPYFKGKEKFWEKEHHYLFGSNNVRYQYISKNIHVKKGYSQDFKKIKNKIRLKISKDKEVIDIVQKLKETEASIQNIVHDNIYQKKRFMPIWYYFEFFIRPFRETFPMKSPEASN